MLFSILKKVALIPSQIVGLLSEATTGQDYLSFLRDQIIRPVVKNLGPGGHGGSEDLRAGAQESHKAHSYIDANGRYIRS